MSDKDPNEVLLGHDELSEDDETIGDLEHADPDPEAIEDENYSLDDIDLDEIAFEDDEEEQDGDSDEDDEDDIYETDEEDE